MLRHLLPRDYAKEYRTFRPLNRQQMNTRLSSICRKKPTTVTAAKYIHTRNTFHHDRLAALEGPPLAFRTCPIGEAETVSPEKLSLATHPQQAIVEVLTASPGTELDVTSSRRLQESSLGTDVEIVDPSLLLLDGSIILQKPANSPEGMEVKSLNYCPDARTDARMRTRFSLRSSGASLQSLEKRLAHKSLYLAGHIQSVLRLSLTNSWRSSLSWKSSWLARLSSQDETEPDSSMLSHDGPSVISSNEQLGTTVARPKYDPLTPERRRAWNKLIRMAELSSYPHGEERTGDGCLDATLQDYHWRGPSAHSCCKGTQYSRSEEDRCLRCGSEYLHRRLLANTSAITLEMLQMIFPGPVGDLDKTLNSPDNLGNTPLHYAAVGWATQPTSLIQLLVLGMKGHLRNVLGQTFLHVLLSHVSFADLPSICDLLRYLRATAFDFTTRDFHGRTAVLHLFATATEISELHLPFLQNVLHITGYDIATVDSRGNSLTHHLSHLVTLPEGPTRLEIVAALTSNLISSRSSQSEFCETITQKYSENWPGWVLWVSECHQSTWVDALGDSPILALLKCWEHSEDDEREIPTLVKKLVSLGADIHMRDRKGDTALSVAVTRGLRPAVSTLMKLGASQYSRRYDGKTVMDNGVAELCRAKRDGNDKLYAMILSCITYLSDRAGSDVSFN